jgi:ABC-2 type transport system permease protein
MNWNVLSAIFKRNFASYFSSPTGYVFICVFVVLSSLAQFWSPEFFSSNLANLDQLSQYMPFILLVFIPAITMSLWAEERKEGTDELLLTIPASDLEVVLGKYLAAVAIYTTALLFSAFSIYLIFLWGLGYPDLGLFVGTYVGYWFIGIAMLAVGMIASFLTRNLTVAFILGMLFNFPLAVAGAADALVRDPYLATAVRRWSAAEQLQDFERGVISLSGMSYFLLIAAVGVYLSVVLIGRRHWRGGKDGKSMLGHYVARVVALVAIVFGANVFFSYNDWLRADITGDRLSSLSPDTERLIQQITNNDETHPIRVDVYASPQVPAEYVETKLNLLSTLDEMASLSGGKIQVQKHIVESFSDEATRAQETFGIEPREVSTRREGKRTQEEIFLGFAATSGLDKVVVPFVDRGVPIEYELIRSIVTVAQDERKKLGIVRTDVPLFGGGFSMTGGMQPESELVTELKKQYKVVEIDPSSPIGEEVDVLLAVQPSSLDPTAMDNFVAAVQSGIPTAVLEDPLPVMYNVVGTTQPKQPPGGMFGMGQPPQPKGDINKLWNALGVEMVDGGNSVIWQDFNPEPKAELYVQPEFIFIDKSLSALEMGAYKPFNDENVVSAGLRQVLLLFAGAWSKDRRSKLEYTELASTGKMTGTVGVTETMPILPLLNLNPYAYAQEMRYKRVQRNRNNEYKVAVYVHGKRPLDEVSLPDLERELETATDKEAAAGDPAPGEEDAADSSAEDSAGEVPQGPDQPELNVMLVADIDWVAPAIFQVRQIGNSEDFDVNWKLQNVTFLLNMLDYLAGEHDFIEIRKRERTHRLLTQIEQETSDARLSSLEKQTEFIKEVTDEIASFRQDFQKRVEEMQSKWANLPARDRAIQAKILRDRETQRLEAQIAAKQQEQERAIDEIQRELELDIRSVQDKWKILALVLPPIPPMLLAFFVFFHRRRGEQEGVARSRLR